VITFVVGAAAYVLLTGSSAPNPVGRGSRAPGFTLPRLGSDAAVTLSDLRGKVVLVNFWATWCKSCADEMPAMERLYRNLQGGDFEMLAISVGEDPAVVSAFRDRVGFTFPTLIDRNRTVAVEWQTFALPESLLIDRDGTILERYVGPRDWDAPAYLARIQRLLDTAAPPS
jgi:cytochrome c biogenesis protein CcmG/thiol:disulfide interchange protein DsbE